MKKLIIIATLALFASCTRCYECTNHNKVIEACKGSWQYDQAKEHGFVTDITGQSFECIPKRGL